MLTERRIMEIEELDKAYAAGFFDGEGCVRIAAPRGNRGYTVIVSVGQKDVAPLLFLRKIWGGQIAHRMKTDSSEWTISSALAGEFLSAIAPYLKCKKEVSRLALELQKTKSFSLRSTPEYLGWCSSIRAEISRLNQVA